MPQVPTAGDVVERNLYHNLWFNSPHLFHFIDVHVPCALLWQVGKWA
jgi:hypothetical protein